MKLVGWHTKLSACQVYSVKQCWGAKVTVECVKEKQKGIEDNVYFLKILNCFLYGFFLFF